MDKPEFIYVTYISSSPERLWKALVEPAITAKYWQHVNVSDWRPGSRWEHRRNGPEGDVLLVGKVVESTPPKRLVLTWVFPADEAKPEKHTRVTFELEQIGEVVKLTVTHDQLEPGSEMLASITDGWPKVFSSLKTLQEAGRPLPFLW
jgi:uncharacterized protein YndB with AHSA1/START domain